MEGPCQGLTFWLFVRSGQPRCYRASWQIATILAAFQREAAIRSRHRSWFAPQL